VSLGTSLFPLSFRTPLLPCHSERLIPVSFRTPLLPCHSERPSSPVIPNVLFPCHSERSEESAVGNTAGDGAKLEEIPRRCAPRNDKELQAPRNEKGSQAPRNDKGLQAPRKDKGSLRSSQRQEEVTLGTSLFPLSFRTPLLPCHSERPSSPVIPNVLFPCHSERSEESAVGNTAGDGAKLEEIPRRCAPRNDKGSQTPRNGKDSQTPRKDRKE
jgi:hypothetical protein